MPLHPLPPTELDPQAVSALREAVAGQMGYHALLSHFRQLLTLHRLAALPGDLALLLWQCAESRLSPQLAESSYRFLRRRASERRTWKEIILEPADAALRLLDWQVIRRSMAYDAVIQSFDRLGPRSDHTIQAILQSRLTAAAIYEREPAELDDLLTRLVALHAPLPIQALSTLGTCAQYPTLQPIWLPQLINALQRAIKASEDTELQTYLQLATTQLDGGKPGT